MPFETALALATIGLRPLHPLAGAEVTGLALARPLAAPMAEVLHDALIEHGVLLIRDQAADQAALAALAAQLAAIEAPLLDQGLHQAPLTLPLSIGAPPEVPPPGAGPFWHADRSYAASPALACIAHAELAGGRIAFADQRAAAARLPPGLRAQIETLQAEHRNPAAPAQHAEHPVLRRHPITGDATLAVSPGFTTRILNRTAAESRALLARLFAAATDAALVFTHACQPGDVVIWDNRRMLHTACTAAGITRLRIEGDRPVGAQALAMPWVSAG